MPFYGVKIKARNSLSSPRDSHLAKQRWPSTEEVELGDRLVKVDGTRS